MRFRERTSLLVTAVVIASKAEEAILATKFFEREITAR